MAFHERARRYLKIAGRIFWNKWFRRGRQAKFSTEDYPGSIGQEFIPKVGYATVLLYIVSFFHDLLITLTIDTKILLTIHMELSPN